MWSYLSYNNVYCVVYRFTLFRRALDAEEKDLSCLTCSDAQDVVSAGPLNSCSFANCSVKIKVQYLQ